ncbi:hypothetical protein V8C86DRAFT_2624043 [Haematococcus lacustris]
MMDTCEVEGGQVHLLAHTPQCEVLLLYGVDHWADLLPGGLDGLYDLAGCHHGKPYYLRRHSPPGEERCLAWSGLGGDWQFSFGEEPLADNLIMYGTVGKVSMSEPIIKHNSKILCL